MCLTLSRGHRQRIFRNTVLKKVFGRKKEDVVGNWRKLLTEEVYNLPSKLNITRAIESINLIWTGRVTHMERREIYTGFWWGNVKEKDRLEDVGVDKRVMLKRILQIFIGRA